MIEEKKIILDCICGENLYLRFWKFPDESFWSVCLSYNKIGLWQRIRAAWLHIIRGRDWDDIIISDEDGKRLKEIL